MKKILFFAVYCIFFLNVVSCSNDEQVIENKMNKKTISVYELSQNENFMNMITEMNNYSKFIKETIEESNVSSSEFKNKFEIIMNSDLSDDEKVEQLNSVFGEDLVKKMEKNSFVINKNWKVLTSQYSNIDEVLLTETLNSYLGGNFRAFGVSNCSWKHYVCMSAAILCHSTCVGGTGGFGAPACYLMCGSIQSMAVIECTERYCDSSPRKQQDSLN